MLTIIEKLTNNIINYCALSLSVISLYTAFFGTFETMVQRTLHLSLIGVIALFKYPLIKSKRFPLLEFTSNIVLAALLISGNLYMVLNWQNLYIEPFMTTVGIIIGVCTIAVLLEITRRTVGAALVIISFCFLLYTYFGNSIPGFLSHRGYDVERILVQIYAGTEGIYGIPLGVCATVVIVFILFGSFIDVAGASNVFLNLSMAMMGTKRGAAAKVAIFSSGLMGMLSGSPAANVATTGAITIPMMKKSGVTAYAAGAIEATASSGGYKTPPIMGAAAFIMAQAIGVSYFDICIAATLPAFFHYFGLYFMVDFYAGAIGLKGQKSENLPDFFPVLKKGFIFIIPIALLIILLVARYTAMYACAYSLLVLWIIGIFSKNLTIQKIIRALKESGTRMVMISIPCATAGIILGILTLTGIGMKLSDIINYVAGDSLFLTLISIMVISIILGMGLPPIVSYIVLAALEAPVLVSMGIEPIAAHLFIFYYCTLSLLTPPICTTAFTAASIAEAPPMRTGFESVRFGIVLFTVPFLFVYNPSLLMHGSIYGIIYVTLIAAAGVLALAISAQGFLFRKIGPAKRSAFALGSILIFWPTYTIAIVGIILFLTLFFIEKIQAPKKVTEFA
jgi:TRAP transporter 4TM/12TM fusion protein